MRSFAGTGIFQSFVHDLLSCADPEAAERLSSQSSLVFLVVTSIRYADRTEKTPFFSKCHAQKSS
jgi:hypothetical protein